MTFPTTLPPRRADWRARLTQYLAAAARRRFRSGEHDCALFAAGAIMAMTGDDPADGWRGAYRTMHDGLAALAAAGYADHVAVAAAMMAECPPAYARAGDIAVLPSDNDIPALGVVQGPGVYCLRPSGLVIADRSEILRAFRV